MMWTAALALATLAATAPPSSTSSQSPDAPGGATATTGNTSPPSAEAQAPPSVATVETPRNTSRYGRDCRVADRVVRDGDSFARTELNVCASNTLRVADGATITVPEGATLVLEAPTVVVGEGVRFTAGKGPANVDIRADFAPGIARAIETSLQAKAAADRVDVKVAGADVNPEIAERIALTISGGISLGAYEAGYNWAFVQRLRARADPREARELSAITGASAGSINTLLTAVSWCMDKNAGNQDKELAAIVAKENSVDENIFWRTWGGIGLKELFPGRSSCREYADAVGDPAVCAGDGPVYTADDGVFTRKAFGKVERDLTDLVTRKGLFVACKIPIGLPVTRVVPTSAGAEGIVTPNDRFSVSLEASLAPEGTPTTGGLQFKLGRECNWVGEYLRPVTEPREVKRAADGQPLDAKRARTEKETADAKATDRAGKTSDPESSGAADADARRRISFPAILDLVEASSAFPVAFGPKRLTFQSQKDPEQILEAPFIDGGLFDNVPIGLALSFVAKTTGKDYDANGLPANQSCQDWGPFVRLFAIDPGSRRHVLDPDAFAVDGKPRRGLASLSGLVQSFVSVSRKYELQALARYILRNDPPGERATCDSHGGSEARGAGRVRVSTRYYPVFGDYLGGFGAFLAKDFRRHDFYVGVYDAAWDDAVAAIGLCDGRGRIASTDLRSIVQRMVSTHDALGLRTDSSYSFRHLLASEIRSVLNGDAKHFVDNVRVRATVTSNGNGDSKELTLRAWLERPTSYAPVTAALLEANDAYLAGVQAAYEAGPDAYRAFAAKDHVAELVARLEDQGGDFGLEIAYRPPREDPTRWYMPQLEALLERLRTLDRDDHSRGAVIAGSGIAAVAASYERLGKNGWQWDPSSVPDRHLDALRLGGHLFPFAVGYAPRAVDLRWRPTWAFHEHLAVVFPASLRPRTSLDGYFGARFGGGVEVRFNNLYLTSIEASAGRWPSFNDWRRRYDAELNVGFAGDKVRLGISVYRDRLDGWQAGPTVALSDLNGILYWAAESFR